jgi:SAM-dependent methyltransferase
MAGILFYISIIIIAAGLLALTFVGASMAAFFFSKVPFAPTPKYNVKIIIDQFGLKPGHKFYDLGCGDGRFLIEAEKRGAKAVGFEISPWVYLRCRLNLFLNKSKAKVFYKNFYSADLSDASAIFCFLMDRVMPKVEKKLKKELGIGAKIICYCFKLPTWKPTKIIDLKPKDPKSSNIYIYSKMNP